MRVTLLDYTGAGSNDPADYAASVLIFTKNTRLEMSPGGLEEIRAWPTERKMEALAYMANTVPSSWEFAHYSFIIEKVTRAFTHQLVRSRNNSYAQQAMRVLKMKGWEYGTGPSISGDAYLRTIYQEGMTEIANTYDDLINAGAEAEDARGILPTNILTNICMSASLRSVAELYLKRSSSRVQSEYRAVIEGIKAEVTRVHPWASLFFDRTFNTAAINLDMEIQEIDDPVKRTRMVKLLDQMRNKVD